MYNNVWKIFLSNIFIYTILFIIYLPESIKSSPINYHQAPVQQTSQLNTTNNYRFDAWSLYNNPEEDVYYQGDIVILNTPKTITAFKEQFWPHGIVHYTIDEVIENSPRQFGIVKEAMQTIMENTCIKFRRIYPDRYGRHPVQSWVNIVGKYSGCVSTFGRNPLGGPSILNLNVDTCFDVKGHVLHELLHILGIYHEHTRPDRDQYIDIIWHNIKDGNEHNFQLLDVNVIQDYGLPYDYDSIMHYSMTAFSKDKSLATIVPKRGDKKIGQRDHLSYYDVQKLLITYGCSQTHFPDQLLYADETEPVSSDSINNMTDISENEITTTTTSTTENNISEDSISTTPFESSDKTDNVNLPTTDYPQSEYNSKDIEHISNDIEDNSNDIEHNSNDIEHNLNDIEHNSNDIEHNSNDIEHNSKDIEHNSNDIKHNSNDIKHNSNDIEHNSKDIEQIPKDIEHNSNDIEQIPKDIEHNSNDIEQIPKDIEHDSKDIEHNSKDIEHIPKDIENIPKDIEHNSKDIENYAINPNFIYVSFPIYNFHYYD